MRLLKKFISLEASGGICLMVSAALALLIANGPLQSVYAAYWTQPLGMLSLKGWINDGLMALFFLLVGLELKREFTIGGLNTPRQAALPFAAALGGMIVPCGIYLLINDGIAEHMRGWAIPAATDIAFALGVLSLLGSRVPAALKLFLTAIAIFDDLGAIVIIGLFYTSTLNLIALGAALALIALLYVLNRRDIQNVWFYLLAGAGLWLALHHSGIHATLAGVITAFSIPVTRSQTLEHFLHPWVAFAILPLFALANAGLTLSSLQLADLAAPLPLGIMLGLVIGKPLGIIGGTWLALHLNWALKPPALTMRHLLGAGVLGGIGFTMSLFIAGLAFIDPLYQQAQLGVLMGSLLAAIIGYSILRH